MQFFSSITKKIAVLIFDILEKMGVPGYSSDEIAQDVIAREILRQDWINSKI